MTQLETSEGIEEGNSSSSENHVVRRDSQQKSLPLTVIVQSMKIPVKVAEATFKPWVLGTSRSSWSEIERRGVIYDLELAESQKEVIEKAQQIAFERGLELKVLDIARLNAWSRLIWRIRANKMKPPFIISPPNLLDWQGNLQINVRFDD